MGVANLTMFGDRKSLWFCSFWNSCLFFSRHAVL
jgi:hypothetical protein